MKDAEEVTKCEKILSWMSPGPDSSLDQRTIASIQKSLSQLQHPNIMTTDLIVLQSHGCLTVRKLISNGSLKDYIHDTKPKLNYLKKTMKPKNLKNFELNTIRTLGYQILSTLKFLHEKNLAHGNLHSGNIFIENGKGISGAICISELENYLIGGSSILRPFIIQLKGPSSSAEAVDVYSFGHLIYEMAVGYPLNNATCDNAIPNNLPEMLSKTLKLHQFLHEIEENEGL